MNTAAQHLHSCLNHLDRARTSAALACSEIAGTPRSQQATDALNDILEAQRSIRVLRDGLASDESAGSPPSLTGSAEEGAVSSAAPSALLQNVFCIRGSED